jgi:hypothetical protein
MICAKVLLALTGETKKTELLLTTLVLAFHNFCIHA